MEQPENTDKFEKPPVHVAIIMDGNGRWAATRGKPRLAGHQAGTENLRRIITASVEFGIKILTIYAFSTENWSRPRAEVDGLMNILADVIDRELNELNQQGVQLRHIGRMEGLSPTIKKKVRRAIELTKSNSRLILQVAFNYGGRDEIIYAIQSIIKARKKPEEITEALVKQNLFTAGIQDPDLVIRTSGEMRTSNFLMWQSAYAEWYVTPVLWPDFDKEELRKALIEYGCRERRFGGVTCEDE